MVVLKIHGSLCYSTLFVLILFVSNSSCQTNLTESPDIIPLSTCAQGLVTCGQACCNTVAGQFCADASSSLCCYTPNQATDGICCPSRYKNCGGNCCGGTCERIPRHGLPALAICRYETDAQCQAVGGYQLCAADGNCTLGHCFEGCCFPLLCHAGSACGNTCCTASQICGDASISLCCPIGQVASNGVCCPPGEVGSAGICCPQYAYKTWAARCGG